MSRSAALASWANRYSRAFPQLREVARCQLRRDWPRWQPLCRAVAVTRRLGGVQPAPCAPVGALAQPWSRPPAHERGHPTWIFLCRRRCPDRDGLISKPHEVRRHLVRVSLRGRPRHSHVQGRCGRPPRDGAVRRRGRPQARCATWRWLAVRPGAASGMGHGTWDCVGAVRLHTGWRCHGVAVRSRHSVRSQAQPGPAALRRRAAGEMHVVGWS